MAYTKEGEGPCPIVFIHGAGGDARLFEAQLAALGPRYGALAVDLPGHGESGEATSAEFHYYADAVAALMDHLGINRFFAAGHSMGGGVVFDLCVMRPDTVAGAILMAAADVMPVNPAIFDLIASDFGSFISFAAPLCFNDGDSSPAAGLFRQSLSRTGPVTTGRDFSFCAAFNYTDTAMKLELPALLVACEKDRMISLKRISALKDSWKGSSLQVINGGGHMPFCDYPGEVSAFIEDFMNDLVEKND